MKRKILSIVLTLVMVLCALPAIPLLSHAVEPLVWDGDYMALYAGADSLVAELDFTAINADTVGTYNASSSVDSYKDKVFLEPDESLTLQTGHDTGYHYYIRISAGKYKGSFMMLTSTGKNAGTVAPSNRVMAGESGHDFLSVDKKFTGFNRLGQSGKSARILNANYFTPEQIKSQVAYFNSQQSFYYASDDHNTGEGFTTQLVTAGKGGTEFYHQINLFSNLLAWRQPNNYHYRQAGNVHQYTAMFLPNKTTTFTDVATLNADNTVTAVPYLDGAPMFSDYSNTREQVVGTHDNFICIDVFVPYYYRLYSTKLTADEMKYNNFIDMCRYTGADMTTFINATDEQKADVLAYFEPLRIGDRGIEKEKIEYFVNKIVAGEEVGDIGDEIELPYVLDPTYAKYKDLYYDDGHLMSFLNLSKLTENDVKYNTGVLNGEDGVEGGRLIIGESISSNINAVHKTQGLHSYVRIIGGKYAGGYYPIVGNNISVTSDGFIDFHEPYAQYGARPEGIYFAKVFNGNQVVSQIAPRTHEGAKVSDFILANSDVGYDGYYGNITFEGVYNIGYEGYASQNPQAQTFVNILGHNGNSGLGSFMVTHGGMDIGLFATGHATTESSHSEVKGWSANSTYHFQFNLSYKTRDKIYRTIYVVDSKDKGIKSTNSGTAHDYDFAPNMVEDIRATQKGVRMYYIRLYDKALTDEQLLQNHFADLCYYYELDGVEELLLFGKYILTKEFYEAFSQYNVGVSDSYKSAMQSVINTAITNAYANIDFNSLKKIIDDKHAELSSLASSSGVSLEAAKGIVTEIDGYIEQALGMIAVNEEAEAIIADSVEKLLAIKTNVDSYVQGMTEINNEISASKEIIDEAKSTADANSLDRDTLLGAYGTLWGESALITEGSLSNANTLTLARNAATDVIGLVRYVASANANAEFDITDYIRFAGFQIRITDFAAMRAVFTVNGSAISGGYTYGDNSYQIVATGLLYGKKDVAITVTYKDGRCVADTDGIRVQLTDSWYKAEEMTAKASAKTGLAGDAYAIATSFNTTPYYDRANAYQEEYRYRAFAVLAGEGTTFIKYLDAESANVGDTVSVYELAKYSETRIEEKYLDDKYYITKVISVVTKEEEA